MAKKYDVGILGWWYGQNYGSMLTYYSFNKAVTNMGYSVVMIHEALGYNGWRVKWGTDIEPMNFARRQGYNFTEQQHFSENKNLNELADTFMVGSDQLWNPHIGRVNDDLFLDFTDDDKKRIAYATSFGNANKDKFKPEFISKHKANLERFDAISVRENYAVDIAENVFGVYTDQVLDPVFLLDQSEFSQLAEGATTRPEGDYLLSFILDPTEEKKRVINASASKLGITKVVVITDASEQSLAIARKVFNEEMFEVISEVKPENYLYAYKNAKYVITDSFHGSCFSFIFRKPFSVFFNNKRGADRFKNLMDLFGLGDSRRIYETATDEEIQKNENVSYSIDYTKAVGQVAVEREKSLNWLKLALSEPKKKEKILPTSSTASIPTTKAPAATKDVVQEDMVAKVLKNPDTVKARILVSLLHEYGIKHIVLSPGGRDLTLVRLVENNTKLFKSYHVTDERSAGYFALGLAVKLGEPVAMICTSGTAASNYLPAITEAFFQGVPLIAITADRYPMWAFQGEDQTIPQNDMYGKVVKKSVTTPVTEGPRSEWETRRLVSEAILEATHNGSGPVHINMPFDKVENIAPPKEVYVLPKVKMIRRVTRNDADTKWQEYVTHLKKSKRILILYGQNFKPTVKQQEKIDAFASKYNCVILADWLSNLWGENVVHSFNSLRAMQQLEFNKELLPDIVITVGGKSVMNHPINFKLRRAPQSMRHWRVAPDGNIADLYFHLTSVLECTQDWFFEYFSDHTGDISNNKEYLNKWKELDLKHPAPTHTVYNQKYITQQLMLSMPEHSIYHLGVGHTFMMAHTEALQPEKQFEVYCNMGTNGIDGSSSSFMGQAELASEDQLAFLVIGDMSFFYDMNSVWNKKLRGNLRIVLLNNSGSGLLKHYRSPGITQQHATIAEGWVKSLGFTYLSSKDKDGFDTNLKRFTSSDIDESMFFEVFI
ncbi:2-succinyl-5-enolpyruvyl-6-hydroxy-3-cyclohexene-1-carboxylic-acid synthase [Enterococcus sp. BWB1-3]|uniref:2-succinyl-5-enolpyruvyl-6-hydroxy-3- cyclohexene-1-carboxylic-acid synthase n=1 Tax=Enterococcus sp. BWB1-3 TaxID=2787713 RepID=UPI001921A567|nr:2-succinyl-5-enolpyruvyl-6-hydroxy-3-cyclohexene-1-carboxylic-acid synthase [Enterococcus sp. BWB1-3]MBL1230701.1 2-succinyl-5-enolpyruvyl-6-hydroxy-3-cyclohexene-1-carboxylic-acid synthase [Enterococcus sp. BWB1-3]